MSFEHTLKNAYIGYPTPPWAVAYYPLTQNGNDYSWNWNHLTTVWTITYSNQWAETALWPSNYLYNANPTNIPIWNSPRTYAFWAYVTTNGYPVYIWWNSAGQAFIVNYRTSSQWHLTTFSYDWTRLTRPANWWYCHVCTYDWSTWKWYVNNSEIYSWSITTNTTTGIWVFNNITWTDSGASNFSWKVWHLAIIGRVRTATERTDYFNQTKSLYGIS